MYTIITQEMHKCYTKTVIGQTIKSGHLLLRELIYGIISLCIRNKLGHIPYSRQQLKSISFIRDTIIYEAIVKFR